ncbi:MAG TPA: acetoin utilization protein AcuC [Gammaproteobacteria bacterium]|nr:acetoin utilization protein AcuC [Gammaproteobacteria bacterium]
MYIGEALARYGFGAGHPFGPDRMDAFWKRACAQGLDRQVAVREPVAADQALIERFHSHQYVEQVKVQSRTGSGFLDCGDTPAFPGVYEAAATVVGTTVQAAWNLLDGRCRRAFSPIAGLHHARRDGAAGFCVFNDCGVAIETLRDRGVGRVAYVDIDAHHGDGVFYAFEDDPDLIFADLHEDGRYLYPGTGAADEQGRGPGRGSKLNIPMAPDAGDEAFRAAFDRVETFLEDRQPQFILFQCGADSVAGDPITHLRYSSAAHAYAARRLCALADRCCEGRLLAMGGGGYSRANLAAAWSAVLAELVACTR